MKNKIDKCYFAEYIQKQKEGGFSMRKIKSGRHFEEGVFGFTEVPIPGPKRSRRHLMEEVMMTPLLTQNEDGEIETYNPANPSERWGKSGKILEAVRKNLPRRFLGKKVPKPALYLAIGSSLDYWWGIDAFVYWNGFKITIDASLRNKSPHWKHVDLGVARLRADILLMPNNISSDVAINQLGEEIARRLKKKNKIQRWKALSRGVRRSINSNRYTV